MEDFPGPGALVSKGRERYDGSMKIATIALGLAGLTLVLAGCGAQRGPEPISHGMSPAQVQKEVLARIHNWQSISENVTEVTYGAHKKRTVYHVRLLSQANPASFRLDITPNAGQPYEIIDNGLNTVVYQNGAKHYSVLTAEPPSSHEFRILGNDLAQVIQKSHAVSVKVKAKEVVLRMLSPVSQGITAKTTLWFNLTTNTPSRWAAVWPGGSLEETPNNIVVNPKVSASDFAFVPPSGVKPEVALTAQGTELNMARAQVPFAIVLPPASSVLVLNNVDVSTEHTGRVVLLTYQTQGGEPVLITETKSTTFKPPAGMAMVSESVGLITAKVGPLPSGGEMAAITLNRTLVVVEGPTSVVDALVNGWGSASPSSFSP